MITRAQWQIPLQDGQPTRARYEPASAARTGALFVCAHGAGGHMDDSGVTRLGATLRARGLDVLLFNFPYAERRSRRPDPMPLLRNCFEAVVARAREELGTRPLILGGRSMGGRVASMLVADGFPCLGLLLVAYPLHPAGKPQQLRSAHLPRIRVPVLCVNGTRDALCTRERMESVVSSLGSHWTMHWIEKADHAFHVPRASGRSDQQVQQELGEAVGHWLSRLEGSA